MRLSGTLRALGDLLLRRGVADVAKEYLACVFATLKPGQVILFHSTNTDFWTLDSDFPNLDLTYVGLGSGDWDTGLSIE